MYLSIVANHLHATAFLSLRVSTPFVFLWRGKSLLAARFSIGVLESNSIARMWHSG
jgi:hypothetical protein